MDNGSEGSGIDEAVGAAIELFMVGRIDDSEKACREALRTHPKHADGLHLLAGICFQKGDAAQALKLMKQAIREKPLSAPFHLNHAIMLENQGHHEDALTAYGEAIRLDPAMDQPLIGRGNVNVRLGRFADALADYDRAVALAPTAAAVHLNRAVILRRLGRLEEALAAYDRALELQPRSPDIFANRGLVLVDLGRTEEALRDYERALGLNPDHAEARNNRGKLLTRTGRITAAITELEHAIRIKPDLATAHNNLGNALKGKCDLAGAARAYRTALRIRPGFPKVHSNYLFCLSYDPAVTDQELADAHREWGQRHGRPQRAYTTWPNAPAPDKPLTVGLVSADLHSHPTGYFLEGVLSAADREHLCFVCYYCGAIEDSLTARLRSLSDQWRSVQNHSDRQLAEAIRADDIDILIDLSGHTRGNRLPCFALKPAPVQVTWLGSCHTTGVPAMDYILLDPTYVPAGCEGWFTEKVVRLPDIRWIYTAPPYAPEVAPPPVLERGTITFGSFNNMTKINAQVIELWSHVLAAVPDSRLMLSWKTLGDEKECDRWRALFAAEGVSGDRLILTPGPGAHAKVLGDYAQVDIALDPFPFSGCISTCEALWMGVPLVTLPGPRPASRQTLGFLTAAGLTEWVADDADEYIRIAADLASDPNRLAALRRDQRARLAASPMCDQRRFAGHLEHVLRRMWRRWCEEQGS